MALHTLCDHVVHIELLSADPEISTTCADVLTESFRDREVDVSGEGGVLQLRSEASLPVTAREVAEALLAAGARTQAIYERREWSVIEFPQSSIAVAAGGSRS